MPPSSQGSSALGESAEGFVTFDTAVTTVAEIVSELEEMTGFSATERAYRG